MVELIVVIIILGIVSVYVAPQVNLGLGMRSVAWYDQVVSSIQYARETAVSHRRLVCMTVGSTSITLQIASANPATTCNTALAGPDGSSTFTQEVSSSGTLAIWPVAGGMVYFQPDGRISNDGSGTILTGRAITVSDESSLYITIHPETGHVEIE